MKLSDIKPLKEYYIGILSPLSEEQVMNFFEEAIQQKFHIVVKTDGPTAFIYKYSFDSRNFLYILVDSKTKQYFGHATFQKINSDIFQPIDITIITSLRGNELAPRLYSFISKSENISIINGQQLSLSAEKMWIKFKNKKIYNIKENKIYDISEENKNYPKNDNAHSNQIWFYIWKETNNILECFKYLGPSFNYNLFLENKPCYAIGNKQIMITPMSPIFSQTIK